MLHALQQGITRDHLNAKSILLVEGNPQNELLILRWLKRNIVNVIDVARDGQQALVCLFRHGESKARKF